MLNGVSNDYSEPVFGNVPYDTWKCKSFDHTFDFDVAILLFQFLYLWPMGNQLILLGYKIRPSFFNKWHFKVVPYDTQCVVRDMSRTPHHIYCISLGCFDYYKVETHWSDINWNWIGLCLSLVNMKYVIPTILTDFKYMYSIVKAFSCTGDFHWSKLLDIGY